MDKKVQAFDSIYDELRRLMDQSDTTTTDPEGQESSKLINKLNNDTIISYSIDDDVQQMRSDLKKSCQLFQTAGEAFESINFNCLKHRIRDLHLSASQSEIDEVMEEKDVSQSLNKLTDIMGHKFRQHPGEFGDIPELSCFFKACSQLQHGLDQLRINSMEMDELGDRMNIANNQTRRRIEDIQKVVNK